MSAGSASVRASRRSSVFLRGRRSTTNYLTRDSFVAKYPFVDYQFEMFTQVMRGLSDNDLFTGRSLMVVRVRCWVCQQIAAGADG